MPISRRCNLALLLTAGLAVCQQKPYFPPAGAWAQKTPAEAGLHPERLREAIQYAQSNGSDWEFEKDQVRTFGRPLGPLPASRARTNGLILQGGYIVAEFGDTLQPDPMYSAAKSFLSTMAGLAYDRRRIRDVNEPVGKSVRDGGYDSPQNALVTWHHHLQQTSEWEGEMWGKKSDFLGKEEFGAGARQPRELKAPGTHYEYNDVRINRLSLSLLRLFQKPLNDVLRDEVMKPIGASDSWKWVPYDNSWVEIGGKRMPSVSGGTRWGGGLWMNSRDMARFGLLFLRGGQWNGRTLISRDWIGKATTRGTVGPDYGYLWWLNTEGKAWPDLPKTSFAAIGNGSNVIWVDPEHDLVIGWRWHAGGNKGINEFAKRVLAAMQR